MNRTDVKRQLEDSPPPAGVFSVHNLDSGLRLIASSAHVEAALNRQRFTLRTGSHHNKRLQSDYDDLGVDRFAFEVLEELDRKDLSARELDEELALLEALWQERLGTTTDGDYRHFGPVV